MNVEKIGLFISKIRKERNMTQKELAEKLNVTIQAVSKWERGLGIPDISLFKPLGKIFGVSVMELMEGEKLKDNLNKKQVDNTIINTLKYSQREKRKLKKHAIILTLIIIALAALTVVYTVIKYKKNNSNSTTIFFKNGKNSILEKADGWIYNFQINYLSNGEINYNFNGINFINGQAEYLLEDEIYWQDINNIIMFFYQKKFNKQITTEDLVDLEINNFDLKDIVYLFNKALISKTCNQPIFKGQIFWEYVTDNYTWKLGFLEGYCGPLYVSIDYVYNNGESLTSLIDNNKATIEQIELEKNIKKIEKHIVDNKVFDIPNNLKEIEPYSTLKSKILGEIPPRHEVKMK